MAVPDKDYVVGKMRDIYGDLQYIMLGAWCDWLDGSEYGRNRYNRTRANIVYDRAVDRGYERFLENTRVDIVEKDHAALFVLDNEIVFKFKKGDDKMLSRNYPTQAAIDFHDHNVPLFLWPDMTFCRVEVIYVLNKIETQIDDLFIVARYKDEIVWYERIPIEERPQEEQEGDVVIESAAQFNFEQGSLFADELLEPAEGTEHIEITEKEAGE